MHSKYNNKCQMQMFRHGDRSPAALLANDELNGESSWPNGLGALSLTGVQQLIRLGEYLRERYTGFLSEEYVDTEVNKQHSNNTNNIFKYPDLCPLHRLPACHPQCTSVHAWIVCY
jgi:hypothetical protein